MATTSNGKFVYYAPYEPRNKKPKTRAVKWREHPKAPEPVYKNFAAALNAYIFGKFNLLRNFADDIGVGTATLHKWLADESVPSLASEKKLRAYDPKLGELCEKYVKGARR